MKLLTLTLLGGSEIRLPTGQAVLLPTKKTFALLGYLALRPGKAYARDHLAALLWGDTADEQARKSLRQAMYVLRKALPETEPPSLLMEGETIALNPAAVEVDAAAFERLIGEGTPEALERAVTLYHGDLLEGIGVNEALFTEWLMSERERLRALALQAFADLLAYQSTAGQTQRAIQTAVRLLAMDASQEVVHRALMRLYVRQGRRGAALKQYQVCVAALQREVGTEPEPETKQLYQEILQQRASEPPRSSVEPAQPREARRVLLESRSEPITRDTPLIGREAELVRLRDALDHASRGDGQVVAITGEAGIGKSSVLMALAAEAHERGIRILLGRSYQTEQVLAFGPWVDAFRSGQVVAEVEVFGGLAPLWRAELARLLPQLDVEGAEAAAHPPDHLLLFEAATELVRSLAAKEPVVVMLEDVHWADEMSLRLMAFLARRIRSSRILVVLTIRDEEMASAPVLPQVVDELAHERHFVHLTLTPLSRAGTTALVRSLISASAPGVDARLDAEIWRASAGNPFLVVETIRAIQEGIAPRTPEALPLPERVRRVVAGRLQRLSDRGRHLASVAAVVGREFDFALLQRAAGLDERHAAEGVEELVRRRVLHGLGEQLDFTHEWIREVVYNELLHPPRRKRLHVLVAKALEDLHGRDPERHYAALAGHYRAGEVWEKALVCWRQAGARAMRLSAYRDAVTCFEQALEAVPRLAKTRETLETAIDVRFDLRNALLPLAEFDRLRGYLRDAEVLARILDDRRRLGWVSVYMSHDSRIAGYSTEAADRAAAAQSLAEVLGDSSLRVAADFYLGAARVSLGDYLGAEGLFRRIARSLDDDLNRRHVGHPEFPAVLARAWLAQTLAELGDFEEGIAFGEEGIRLAEALDHAMSLAYACTRVGHLHAMKGELDRAAVLLERGHALTRDWKITYTSALVTADLGYVYALRGHHAEGLSLLRDALDAYEAMKVDVVKPRLLVHLGEAHLLADQIEEAQACAERCLAYTRARGERGYEAYALRLLGEIGSHRDHPPDLKAAEEHYREAGSLAADLGMRPLAAHCHRGLGTLYRRAGQRSVARQHLATAVGMFQQMAMGCWLESAEAELRRLG